MSITFSNWEKFISWDTTPNNNFAVATSLSVSKSKILTWPEVLVTKVPIIPIFIFVLYLGGRAIKTGFNAKSSNKSDSEIKTKNNTNNSSRYNP